MAPELLHSCSRRAPRGYGRDLGHRPCARRPCGGQRCRRHRDPGRGWCRGPGCRGLRETEHSMGGDSFAWYLEKVPGAYARLGVHDPASAQRVALHAGTFDVDERCIGYGVRLLAVTALKALERLEAHGHLAVSADSGGGHRWAGCCVHVLHIGLGHRVQEQYAERIQ